MKMLEEKMGRRRSDEDSHAAKVQPPRAVGDFRVCPSGCSFPQILLDLECGEGAHVISRHTVCRTARRVFVIAQSPAACTALRHQRHLQAARIPRGPTFSREI